MGGFFSRLLGNWIFGNGFGDSVCGDGCTGGIQFFDNASGDLGSATAHGQNSIFANAGANLLNFTENTIPAIGNHWDSADVSEVYESIWDEADDAGDEDGSGFLSGPVLIEPVLEPANSLRSPSVLGRFMSYPRPHRRLEKQRHLGCPGGETRI